MGSERAAFRDRLCLAIGATCLAGPMVVGDLYAAAADGPRYEAAIEEIVVRARRREERLLDTPVAVSVVTEAEIDRRNLKDLADVSKLVPNMIFDVGTGSTGSANNAQIFIRGIGQQDFLFTSDPGVGLYIDDVYYPRGTGVVMDLVDLQQIEVLRGPQGTLFGKNTIGGAINIRTNSPTDELDAVAEVTVGSRDRLDFKGALNLPLIEDTLSLRVAGSTRNQDGHVDRVNPGDELGDTDSDYGRARLRWTPDETWTIDVAADITSKSESSVAEELVDVRPEDPANLLLGLWNVLVAPSYGPGVQMDRRYLSSDYKTQGTGPNHSDFDMWGVSLTIEKSFGEALSLKSITAYRDQDSQFAGDTDHSPLKYTESTNDNDADQVSQEFQLSGTAMGGRLNWVTGAFYMEEEASDGFDVALGSGLFVALEGLPAPLIPLVPGVDCPPPPGVILPCAGGAGNPFNIPLDLDVLISDDIDIESYAVFGEGNFDLTERLNVTAGLRYSKDEKEFTTSLLRRNAGLVTVPPTTVSDSWSDTLPRFGLKYAIRDNAMVYGSVTKGFKSGGFNGRATSLAEIDSFDPEEVWAYEVGAKMTFADERLGLNVAAFFNDYTDMQLLSVRDVQGVIVVVTENAGEVEISGLEVELFATPLEGLSIRSGFGYLDAEYTDLAANATVTKDDDLVKAPEWTAHTAIDYAFAFNRGGGVSIGGDISYTSSYFNELTNEPVLKQDSYSLVGAYLQYRSPEERWLITLFGLNLTDERYMSNGLHSFGSFGNAAANYGPDREWGLKIQARL